MEIRTFPNFVTNYRLIKCKRNVKRTLLKVGLFMNTGSSQAFDTMFYNVDMEIVVRQ